MKFPFGFIKKTQTLKVGQRERGQHVNQQAETDLK